MSKRKISIEDKVYAVNLYLDGKESQNRIVSMFGVSKLFQIIQMVVVPWMIFVKIRNLSKIEVTTLDKEV